MRCELAAPSWRRRGSRALWGLRAVRAPLKKLQTLGPGSPRPHVFGGGSAVDVRNRRAVCMRGSARHWRPGSSRSRAVLGGEFESRRSEASELRSLRACLNEPWSRGSNAPGVRASVPSSRKPSRVSCPRERQAPRAKVRSERRRNRAQRATRVDERSCSARCLSLAGAGHPLRFRKLDCQTPDARAVRTAHFASDSVLSYRATRSPCSRPTKPSRPRTQRADPGQSTARAAHAPSARPWRSHC